ncbi:MAG: hypothetical protein ACREA0_02490 [bacterium]
MTSIDKFALLRDLANLVRKYGPTVFSDLAGFLRDPDAVAELLTILEAAEVAGRKARVPKSRVAPTGARGSKGSLQNLLSELEKDQPEKAQVLSGFYGALAAKRALPTLRELRSFALDNGLKGASATSRDEAMGPLLRDLITRSREDIRSMLGRIRLEDTTGDRTLEGWTGVILDKDRTRRG